MIHLALMLLALNAPIQQDFSPGFRSHPGPRFHLSPELGQFGRGLVETLTHPLHANGGELALMAGAGVVTIALLAFDEQLYAAIEHSSLVRNQFHPLLEASVWLGEGWVDLLVLGAFAVDGERGRRVAVEGTQALVVVAALSTALKRLTRVSRPTTNDGQKLYFQPFHLLDHENDAFPSGHTMSAFATATVLASEYPATTPYAFVAASLVAIAVIEKGWHWPSDVVAGAALGVVLGRGAVLANKYVTFGPGPGLGLSAARSF